MLLPPAFIILCFVFSVGKCQFFYNYEEADAADTPKDEPALYQYNSPSAVSQQFQKETKPRENIQDETNKNNNFDSGNDSAEVIEESNTPRMQRPKKRLYRRVHRQGNYVEPPAIPKTFGPSVFENIGLGQAPSGVYIPQDSFLNVLRNNRQSYSRNNAPSVYTQNNAPSVNNQNIVPSVFYQNDAPQPRFYVQPPPAVESRPETSPIQPNVQYDTNSAESPEEVTSRRNAQSTRPRQQRQQARSSNRSDPVVDIDVLRTPPDVMRPITAAPVQGPRSNQGRSVSRNRQRQTLMIQDYPEATRTPKVYAPSVFQNIGLGEAPRGIDIPADSLLNVLRNPSANSRTSPRVAIESTEYSSQPQEDYSPQPRVEYSPQPRVEYSPQPQVEYSEPAAPEQMPTDTRRRSRQRSRSSNASGRTERRRTVYQYDDETQNSEQSVPASSQQPRSQRTRNTSSERSRGNASGNQASRRQQTARTESQQSQNTERQQRKYKPAKLAIAALPEDTDDDGIPGEAGVDYPTFHTIPRTTFSCGEQLHNGYYADMETSCQVMHLCQAGGVKNSFLCPNGTIFSQEKFSCQWWYKVNCADSPNFYSINDSLYKVPEDKKQRGKE